MPEFHIKSKGGRFLDFPQIEMARGEYPSLSIVHKFGASTSLTTAFAPIAHGGVYKTPIGGTTLEVLSDSTVDSSGDTGARSVMVEGLSTNWTEITETVELNGTTAVQLTNNFNRVYRAYVVDSGTYADDTAGSHVGEITIREAGGGDTWGHIHSGIFPRGQTQIGAYTVPKGKTAYVALYNISIDSSKSGDVIMFQRTNADTTVAPFSSMRTIIELVGLGGSETYPDGGALHGPFTGPCDIGFMAKAAATAQISVDYIIYLVDNEDA